MNPRYILALGTLMLGFNIASCAYEPWEVIKKWYNGMEYDRIGAEERHAAMEKNCIDVVGQHEGLCFDDCMFRNHYELIVINGETASDGKYYYIQDENKGVRKLERGILQVKGVEEMSKPNAEEPYNKEFHQHLSPLQMCRLGLILGPESDTKLKNDYLKSAESLCTQTLHEDEKEILTRIVNCIKGRISN